MNFIISPTVRNALPLIFLQVLDFFFRLCSDFFYGTCISCQKYFNVHLKIAFLSGTIYQRDLMNKPLLYIILVLMQYSCNSDYDFYRNG